MLGVSKVGISFLGLAMMLGLCAAKNSNCPSPGGAATVVRLYAEADARALMVEGESLLLRLILVQDFWPAWDTYEVIEGFEIVNEVYDGDKAEVTVKYFTLGTQPSEGPFDPDEHEELVEYELELQDGIWKIVTPINTPRVLEKYHRQFMEKQKAEE